MVVELRRMGVSHGVTNKHGVLTSKERRISLAMGISPTNNWGLKQENGDSVKCLGDSAVGFSIYIYIFLLET